MIYLYRRDASHGIDLGYSILSRVESKRYPLIFHPITFKTAATLASINVKASAIQFQAAGLSANGWCFNLVPDNKVHT
jgi:hypothetical protein